MKHVRPSQVRILAIDPCPKGLGFAVLEGSKKLIDWGVKEVAGDKNAGCLEQITNLIEHYRLEVIIVENYSGKGSRRCERVEELTDNIRKLASPQTSKATAFPVLG